MLRSAVLSLPPDARYCLLGEFAQLFEAERVARFGQYGGHKEGKKKKRKRSRNRRKYKSRARKRVERSESSSTSRSSDSDSESNHKSRRVGSTSRRERNDSGISGVVNESAAPESGVETKNCPLPVIETEQHEPLQSPEAGSNEPLESPEGGINDAPQPKAGPVGGTNDLDAFSDL